VQVAIAGQNKPDGGFVNGLQPIFSRTIYSSNSTNSTSSSTPVVAPGKSSHTGAIVGGVVGGILGLLLLAGLVWFLLRRRKRNQNTQATNYEAPAPIPPPAPAAGLAVKPYQPQMAEVGDSQGGFHELGGDSVAVPFKPAIPPQELPGNEPNYRH